MTSPTEKRWACVALIALLGFIHSALSYGAVLTKSPTFDEPIHVLGGYCVRYLDDFRVDPEDPPLWHRIHALGARRDDVDIDFGSETWRELLNNGGFHFQLARETYPQSPLGMRRIVNRHRAVMSIFGCVFVISAGLIARSIARRFALPHNVAGLAVATLLAFDPTLLAHSSLVKNDVLFALCVLLACAAMWSVCLQVRWWNVASLVALVAVAPVVKFSGVLLGPMMAFCLMIRALNTRSWNVGAASASSRTLRMLVACSMILLGVVVAVFIVWASYGFRFTIAHDGHPYSFDAVLNTIKLANYRDAFGTNPAIDNLPVLPVDFSTRLIMWSYDQRLFPEGWLFGLLQVHAFSIHRAGYMFGEYTETGFWYFFPVCILAKTPVASVVLFASTIGFAVRRYRAVFACFECRQYLIAFGFPAFIYLMLAMTGSLNLGIRHILPLWPAIYITTGLFIAHVWRSQHRVRRLLVSALVALTAAETVMATPDFLSFFNAPLSNPRTKLWITGESNLDWGQDLPALARWQRKHPNTTLYLSYFGIDDPHSYDINYINIPPGYPYATSLQWPDPRRPGVIAYSATHLLAIYRQDLRQQLMEVRKQQPMEIVGGSIYLYKWPFDAEVPR